MDGIDGTSDDNDTVDISIDDVAEIQNSGPAYDFCIEETASKTCNDTPSDDFCIDEVVVETHSDAPADDSRQSIVQVLFKIMLIEISFSYISYFWPIE